MAHDTDTTAPLPDSSNEHVVTEYSPLLKNESSRKEDRKREDVYFYAMCLTLFLAGWNDGSTGPLLPRMQESYDIGYTLVSMIFVGNCVGCVSAAISNVWLTDRFGFGIVIAAGSVLQTITYCVQAPMPPFVVMGLSYVVNGFGLALQDAQVNSMVAGFPTNTNAKMSVVHGMYGLGGFVAPLISTQFSQMEHWSFHFLVSLALSLVNLTSLAYNFRFKPQESILADIGVAPLDSKTEYQRNQKLGAILRLKTVHLMALFIFVYAGIEVTVGAWSVTFILEERGGGPSSGYVASGFFGGLTIGRFILIWVNKAIGPRRVVYLYIFLCVVLEFNIWFVHSLVWDATAIALVGVFLGPLYPIVMTVSSILIDPSLLPGAIGLIGCVGATGAAAFPFILAVTAEGHGVQVLQPLVLILLGLLFGVWVLLPSASKPTPVAPMTV